MSHTNSYKDYNLVVTINKKLKHSYISIDKEKKIHVKTPHKSPTFVESLLRERSDWIEKQFLKIEQLTLIENVEIHSRDFLKDRVAYFSQEMNLDFKELKLRKMKSRWGSCSSFKVITLNSELLKVREDLIDYVVVHELSHLVHMNHSKAFHSLVEKYLPNSKLLRKELKQIRLS